MSHLPGYRSNADRSGTAGNFIGQFGIDRLPQAGRLYVKNDIGLEEDDGKTIGTNRMLPELFDELDEEELKENESEEKLMSLDFKEVEAEEAKKADNTNKSATKSKPAESAKKPSDADVKPESAEESDAQNLAMSQKRKPNSLRSQQKANPKS